MREPLSKEAIDAHCMKSYIGGRVRDLREDAGLTVEEVGALVNLSGEEIKLLEHGYLRGDALLKLRAIALALEKKLVINFEPLHQERPIDKEKLVTAEWAADFLSVSVDYVKELIAEGVLNCRHNDKAECIYLEPLKIYRQWKKIKMEFGLIEITRLSEDMGLYDMDETPEEIVAGIKEVRREIAAEKAREKQQAEQEPPSA